VSTVVHVALREGFDDDVAVVDVGDERFRFEALSTRLQIGLAEEIDVEVRAGTVEVRISLPEAGLESTGSHVVEGEIWLGIDRVSDALDLTWSAEPFRYA
jgi:hypothetical protein